MLSKRAREVKPSPTLVIDSKAKAMAAAGHDVVNLGVGELDFDTPEFIKKAAIKAIEEGFTKYTPAAGTPQLKNAIVEKFRRDNGLEYKPEEIIVSCGAKHSLYNVAQALYDTGDEILIPAPFWVSYPDQVILNDATPVIVPTREDQHFILDPAVLERHITPKSKAIILNSPSNPTGCVYDRAALEKVADIALRHKLWIVSDEIYEPLIFEGEPHTSIASLGPEVKARTIVINGVSKSHAMTGWRIGYAAGPKPVVDAMTAIQSQSTSNPNSIAQKATVAALNAPNDFIEDAKAEFNRRRKFLCNALNAIPGIRCLPPRGAFYVFPNISDLLGRSVGGRRINSSAELCLYLLEEAKVAVVPGSAFGSEPHMRLSYATSYANLEKAVARLKEALAKLE